MYKNLIIKNLSSDLLHPQFKSLSSKLAGHCYVASEAYYHLSGGEKSGLRPMFVKVNKISHWFLKDSNNKIIDLTAKQFKCKIPYEKAVGKGFLTKNPSKRAQVLISRIER